MSEPSELIKAARHAWQTEHNEERAQALAKTIISDHPKSPEADAARALLENMSTGKAQSPTGVEAPAKSRLKPKKTTEMVGIGCVVQGLGLVMPFLGYTIAGVTGAVVGIFLLIPLLIIGGRQAIKWICPNCNNPIASKQVKVCPACHAQFV